MGLNKSYSIQKICKKLWLWESCCGNKTLREHKNKHTKYQRPVSQRFKCRKFTNYKSNTNISDGNSKGLATLVQWWSWTGPTCTGGLGVSTTEMYSLSPFSFFCNLSTGGSTPQRNSVQQKSILWILKLTWATS